MGDTKETVNDGANLHEQETKCIDGKCNEKVMDGKVFDPQAEARKKAAIAEEKKDSEIAAAAQHKAQHAAAEARAAKKAAERAAVAEKKAEREAAERAMESLPDFSDSGFQHSSLPFLAEASSNVMRSDSITLVGVSAATMLNILAVLRVRRRMPAHEEPQLSKYVTLSA